MYEVDRKFLERMKPKKKKKSSSLGSKALDAIEGLGGAIQKARLGEKAERAAKLSGKLVRKGVKVAGQEGSKQLHKMKADYQADQAFRKQLEMGFKRDMIHAEVKEKHAAKLKQIKEGVSNSYGGYANTYFDTMNSMADKYSPRKRK